MGRRRKKQEVRRNRGEARPIAALLKAKTEKPAHANTNLKCDMYQRLTYMCLEAIGQRGGESEREEKAVTEGEA